VTLSVPAGTTSQPVQIAVTPLSSKEDVSAGFVVVDITMRTLADGTVVSALNKAIDIHYWTPYIGTIPSLQEVGVIWSPMPLVLTPQLPAPLDAAYYIHSDQTYSVFTKSLSTFSFALTQEDLLISNKDRSLRIGQSVKINFAGGSGDGNLVYVSDDLNFCTVTQDGVVTAVAPGQCTIYITKESSNRYLAAVSNSVVFTVKESAQAIAERNSLRNWLIYTRKTDGYQVLINLANSYGNTQAELQYRTYVNGRLVYKKLTDVTLDVNGDATYQSASTLLKGTRLRLVISGTNIKFGVVI
jgi:ribosomal protein S24E